MKSSIVHTTYTHIFIDSAVNFSPFVSLIKISSFGFNFVEIVVSLHFELILIELSFITNYNYYNASCISLSLFTQLFSIRLK